MKDKTKVCASVFTEDLEKIDRIAKEENRSRSDLLEEALRYYLDERERSGVFRTARKIRAKKTGGDPEALEKTVKRVAYAGAEQ
jgi:hypothetical protein